MVEEKATVFFVLGGPGAGKGTQCAELVKNFGFVHLSAGDLLRAERDSGSENAKLINSYIADGKIVPVQITCNLIKNAMESEGMHKKYLIDGFPRSEDNVNGWNEVMGNRVTLGAVLWFDADEKTMTDRILERSASSGRNDDNIETLRKRFAQFNSEQVPIILNFGEQGHKVIKIDAVQSKETVFEYVKNALIELKFI